MNTRNYLSFTLIMIIMGRVSFQIVVISILWLYLLRSSGAVGSEHKIVCKDGEREALLKFKDNLYDDYGLLSSWGKEEGKRECCHWAGIRCDNKSGHVISLDLHSLLNVSVIWYPRGKMFSSSLIELHYLNYLDLSWIDFSGNQIPSFFGEMTSLEYLNLGFDGLQGSIPESFGNMTALVHLDLRYNYLEGSIPEFFGNMTALVHLDLSTNNLEGSIPESIGNMTALVHLYLSSNKLEGSIPESFRNMTALVHLDLSSNKLEGSIPESFRNMTALVHLDLSYNELEGEIGKLAIWNRCALRTLSLSDNNFRGGVQVLSELSDHKSFFKCTNYSLEILDLSRNSIMGLFPNLTLFTSLKELRLSSNQMNGRVPESVGQLSNLEILDLYNNSFEGVVPESVGQLSNLEILDLYNNSFEGVVSETHFSKLSKLKYLDLSLNQLILNVSSDWVPPFQLDYISLSNCTLGPRFPKWLRTQKKYSSLDISNTRISESIPSWFWNPSIGFETVDLSRNQISGTIPNSSIQWETHPEIDLSSNQLEGPIPHFLFQVSALYLSGNEFSGINCLCDVRDESQIIILDVSLNQLSGTIPNCWSNFKSLIAVNLANNKLSGKIPISIGSLTQIEVLHLGNNNLTGELPITLKNCSELVVIDVGHNKLFGTIPSWIGESLKKLAIFVLRSNQFYGSIPSNMCHLQNLQLLDLSINHISGSIPICVGNFTEIKKIGSVSTTIFYSYMDAYGMRRGIDKEEIVWKGTVSEFGKNLGLVKSIDLSCNALEGEIPLEITQLVGLVSLNLSTNNLSGQIPLQIGNMKSLDALDLSDNHLSGHIPSSLGLIERLGVLNLSNNNLTGKIPTATQLQSRDASSYMGNPTLCGAPLHNKCPGEEPSLSEPTNKEASGQEDEDGFISQGFYASMGAGFVVGFWGFVGTLLFNKTWRLAYLKLLNDCVDWIYVIAAVYKQKFLTALKG